LYLEELVLGRLMFRTLQLANFTELMVQLSKVCKITHREDEKGNQDTASYKKPNS
jgi:hypothetical protein